MSGFDYCSILTYKNELSLAPRRKSKHGNCKNFTCETERKSAILWLQVHISFFLFCMKRLHQNMNYPLKQLACLPFSCIDVTHAGQKLSTLWWLRAVDEKYEVLMPDVTLACTMQGLLWSERLQLKTWSMASDVLKNSELCLKVAVTTTSIWSNHF